MSYKHLDKDTFKCKEKKMRCVDVRAADCCYEAEEAKKCRAVLPTIYRCKDCKKTFPIAAHREGPMPKVPNMTLTVFVCPFCFSKNIEEGVATHV